MLVLGLTGSIAMGKSHAADCLASFGLPVMDADACVHELTAPGGSALPLIDEAFPGAVQADRLDREMLGQIVFNDPAAKERLEAILHPMVHETEKVFLKSCARQGSWLAVLDIPLLFETDSASLFDAVAVVSAPRHIQEQRVLKRPGMTKARFEAILANQMPDAEKRKRADFVIATGFDRGLTAKHLADMVEQLSTWQPRAWPAQWLKRNRTDTA